MGFFQQNELFLKLAILPIGNPAPHWISPTGCWTIFVNATSVVLDKDTAGLAIINHCQVTGWKEHAFFPFDDDELLQKHTRVALKLVFEAERIVGGQDQIKLAAAFIEARYIGVAGKAKFFFIVKSTTVFGKVKVVHIFYKKSVIACMRLDKKIFAVLAIMNQYGVHGIPRAELWEGLETTTHGKIPLGVFITFLRIKVIPPDQTKRSHGREPVNSEPG
jgi:hypothetical protein